MEIKVGQIYIHKDHPTHRVEVLGVDDTREEAKCSDLKNNVPLIIPFHLLLRHGNLDEHNEVKMQIKEVLNNE